MSVLFSKIEYLNNIEIVDSRLLLVDGTLSQIEKLSCYRIDHYCRKKFYGINSQVIVEPFSKKVVDVCCTAGSVHDFRLCKNWYLTSTVSRDVFFIGDSGYCGMSIWYSNSISVVKRKSVYMLGEYQKWLIKILVDLELLINV